MDHKTLIYINGFDSNIYINGLKKTLNYVYLYTHTNIHTCLHDLRRPFLLLNLFFIFFGTFSDIYKFIQTPYSKVVKSNLFVGFFKDYIQLLLGPT